jgi:predicted unusual protein kinase regulating ubiquinone biosynthesis (AarF/ABC1/UbiB family)
MGISTGILRGAGWARLGAATLALRLGKGPQAKAWAERYLNESLGELKGLPQKLGQILQMRQPGREAFAGLTEGAPALDGPAAKRLLEQRLGRPLEADFAWFSPRGVGASLSQVHEARLHGGRRVAVKLLLPGIGEALDTDLKGLGWMLLPMGGRRSRGMDLDAYRTEVGRFLHEELDLAREAESLRAFARDLAPLGAAVPLPVEGLQAEGVLVMDWIEGAGLDEAEHWEPARREDCARNLARAVFYMLLRLGRFHADPHPGNVRYQSDGGVGFIDFGCVKELSPAEHAALRGLFQDAVHGRLGDEDRALGWLLQMGFKPELLEPLRGRLSAYLQVLLKPLSHDGPFDASTWDLAAGTEEALGEGRWNFRFAAPAALILLMRLLRGLGGHLARLDVRLDWRELALAELDGEEALLKPSVLPEPVDPSARHLYMKVTDQGRLRVQLVFPERCVNFLHELVPEDVDAKMRAQGADVEALCQDLLRRGSPAGEIFSLDDGPKCVRVWLG